MATKRTSTHDVARRAGVSVGTVSNVVTGKGQVGQELRDRVLRAMTELDWQPNSLARGLRLAHSSIIGMIITDVTNPFFPAVVRGAEDVLTQLGHLMLLCNTDNSAKKELDSFLEMRTFNPAGFLIIPSPDSELERFVDQHQKPLVFVDRKPDSWLGDAVTSDNESGAYQATAHLIRCGHRKLAIITGPLRSANARSRLSGFERACRESGIVISEEFRREAQFTRESGYAAAKNLLNMLPRPTGLFASNDLIAAGAFIAIREAGLRCPDDVSVVGFDNLDFAELMDPSLTSVHQPGYQMGSRAAQLLVSRIQDRTREPQQVLLPTELRVRNSVSTIGHQRRSIRAKKL